MKYHLLQLVPLLLAASPALAEEPSVASAETAVPTPVAPASPRTWNLDPGASTIYVLVKHDPNTTLAGMAHDHTVAATGWSGTVTWSPEDPTACKIDVSVPVGGLVVDPPGLRARAGLEGDTPEDDKAKISENMWGNRQLQKGVFPTMTFSSTGCSGSGTSFTVTGSLTIHGVSKTVSVPMTIAATGDTLTAKGSFPSKASDWGFDPFTAAMGMIKNLDELRFSLDVVGR